MKTLHKIKKIISITSLPALILFQSCSQELDINEDPNNPTVVPVSTLLTNSEVYLGYSLGGEGTRMPASIVQYYGGHRGQPLDYSRYNITSASTDGVWTRMYDILMDYKDIENLSTAKGDNYYIGISQILQSYTFAVATDLFGDIPYSEALKGNQNLTPAYDKQEAIYQNLIVTIDKGISNIKSNVGANPGSADIIFNGDRSKWIKFANSLKLRLLNHLSKRNSAAVVSYLESNPDLITSSTDNAVVRFGKTASNANPIYQFDELSGRKDNAVASTIVDKLKALNDPRIDVYFYKVKNGTAFVGQYRGNSPGDATDDSGESLYSRVGSAYASIDSPVVLISAAEVNFIKAEVYFRTGNIVKAKEAYEAAITEDFSALGVANSSAYIATPNVAFNNTISRIMEQKWITMFQNPAESWVDWRRTGTPILTPSSNNRTSGVIPRRLPYPQIEINVNGTNLQNGPGIPIPYEGLKTKVWWDN